MTDLAERGPAELVDLARAFELSGYTRGHLRRLLNDGALANHGTSDDRSSVRVIFPASLHARFPRQGLTPFRAARWPLWSRGGPDHSSSPRTLTPEPLDWRPHPGRIFSPVQVARARPRNERFVSHGAHQEKVLELQRRRARKELGTRVRKGEGRYTLPGVDGRHGRVRAPVPRATGLPEVRRRRVSLQHRDRAKAEDQAKQLAQSLAEQDPAAPASTLRRLIDRYLQEVTLNK